MKSNWFWAAIIIGASLWGLIGCGEVTVDNASNDGSAGNNSGGTNGTAGNSGIGGRAIVTMGMGGSFAGQNGQGGGSVVPGTGGTQISSDSGLYPLDHLCNNSSECISSNCHNGVCANPLKINGDGCTNNSQCASNWCHPVNGVCQNMPVLRGPGESCVYDWECNGFCNDATIPNTCHLTYASGYGPCIRNSQCGSGICDIGRRLCN